MNPIFKLGKSNQARNIKKKNKSTIITIITTMSMLLFSAGPTHAISAQEAQNQIGQINQQISNINNSLANNQKQQNDIQSVIDAINAQIQILQLQIDETNAKIDLTNQKIADTNDQIAKTQAEYEKQQKIMGEYLKTIYMENQTSTVELIATSNTFSDFVDRNEYLMTMQKKIKETQDKITELKKQLDQKKKDLDAEQAQNLQLRSAQQQQQAAITNQQNYQKKLLSDKQAAANSMSNQKNALSSRKAQISAAYNETINRAAPTQSFISRVFGGSTTYPYGNPPAAGRIDQPDGYGYAIGECTSYAAWKRASVGRPVPRTLGNANTWGVRAAALGLSVNSSPRAGDVMVFPYLQPYGHVAYVEAVYGNGTILISEYNWTPYSYSSRVVNPYNYGAVFIH